MRSHESVRIYRARRPWRTVATVLLTLLAVAATLAILVFFYFKRYIVYTSDSVRLEIPWLQETEETDTSS